MPQLRDLRTMKVWAKLDEIWRAVARSRRQRYMLLLAAAVAAGVLAGRALGARSEQQEEPRKPTAAAAAPAAAPEAPAGNPGAGTGAAVQQVVRVPELPGPAAGFIQDIPNVDFSGLSQAQKEEATRLLNERRCDCNCSMTLAQCRRDDRSCPRSPQVVAAFLGAVRSGASVAAAAEKMYGEAGAAPAAQPAAPAPPSGKLVLYKVEPGNSPAVGPIDAPVTIVEFVDFQCPFCARADQTVERILQEYPGKVRLVFKQHPLSALHPQAMLASEAALAAHEQGRYKEMHAKLFTFQREMSRERVLAAAREIGLDADDLAAALDSGKHRAMVDADTRQAESLGATGTPAFFINGRYLSGARPFEQFKAIIDEELAGKRPPFEWGTNVRAQANSEAQAALQRQQEEEKKVYTIDLKGAVSTGPERAQVTIVEFTDFQCPFCQRVQPTLKQLLTDYKGKVRLVTKNLPLSFHPQARGAAKAALAAHRQGKYWEFRDLLFANNRSLGEDALLGHARALGLNVDRFRADMGSPDIESTITADEKHAQEVGATGTPTFLINGRKLVGAQPLEAFKQRIEAELASGGDKATKAR